MKNIITILFATVTLLTIPSVAFAEEQQVCVTQYGGGTVCGAKTPEFHAPVKTGFADFSLPIIASGFLGISVVLFVKSKKFAH